MADDKPCSEAQLKSSVGQQDNSSEVSTASTVSSSPVKTTREPRRGGGGRRTSGTGGEGHSSQYHHQQHRRGGGGKDQQQQGKRVEEVSAGQEIAGVTKKKNKKYSVKKRAPPKEDFDIKPNDVFVNEKSHFLAQVSKCKKLFDKGHREIFLHGLGKAIPRAINIAFELKKFYLDTVDYTVNTSTVQLLDDLVDLEDPEQPTSVRTRNVSSVDIRVYRSIEIP